MGDELPQIQELTEDEKLERDLKQLVREKYIGRARGAVVRSQIVRAYEILENIRFDFVSDTAFREKIVMAKRNLEYAIDDFLLDDAYWDKRIKDFRNMTLDEYKEYLKEIAVPQQSPVKI